jgi:hypothetical protein
MLQSSMLLTEEAFALLYISGWDLGDVCFTSGIQELLERTHNDERLIQQYLVAHFQGDYGLEGDAVGARRMQCARNEGRTFTGVWNHSGQLVKIVTNQSRGLTTVCLARED